MCACLRAAPSPRNEHRRRHATHHNLLLPGGSGLLGRQHLLLQRRLQLVCLLRQLAAPLIQLRRALLLHLGGGGCLGLCTAQLPARLLRCCFDCCRLVSLGLHCCCLQLVQLLLCRVKEWWKSGDCAARGDRSACLEVSVEQLNLVCNDCIALMCTEE